MGWDEVSAGKDTANILIMLIILITNTVIIRNELCSPLQTLHQQEVLHTFTQEVIITFRQEGASSSLLLVSTRGEPLVFNL